MATAKDVGFLLLNITDTSISLFNVVSTFSSYYIILKSKEILGGFLKAKMTSLYPLLTTLKLLLDQHPTEVMGK